MAISSWIFMNYTSHLMLNNYLDHVHFVMNIHDYTSHLMINNYIDHGHFVMNIHEIYFSLDVKNLSVMSPLFFLFFYFSLRTD